MLPGDRLVCAFVTPPAVGAVFKDWPLHVTIVPWFRVDKGSSALADELRQALSDVRSFEVSAGDSTKFGKQPVSLLTDDQSFIEVENRVRTVLKNQDAWLVDETTKRRRPYRPHVTYQRSGYLSPGDVFDCDRLFIIEQKGGSKEVAAQVELKS